MKWFIVEKLFMMVMIGTRHHDAYNHFECTQQHHNADVKSQWTINKDVYQGRNTKEIENTETDTHSAV